MEKTLEKNIYMYVCMYMHMHMGFPSGSEVKNLPAMQEPQETWVGSLEDPLSREFISFGEEKHSNYERVEDLIRKNRNATY